MLLSLCADLNFRSNLSNLNMFSTHSRLQNPIFIELIGLLIWDDWNSHWLQIKFCKSRSKRQLPTHLRLKFTLVANKIFRKPGQSVNCLVGISSPPMHSIYFHKSALKLFWLFLPQRLLCLLLVQDGFPQRDYVYYDYFWHKDFFGFTMDFLRETWRGPTLWRSCWTSTSSPISPTSSRSKTKTKTYLTNLEQVLEVFPCCKELASIIWFQFTPVRPAVLLLRTMSK